MGQKMERFLAKHAGGMILICVMCMMICFAVCQFLVRRGIVNDYNAMIGRMYQEDAVLAEGAVKYFYLDELTESDIEAGRVAMGVFGYTGDGMEHAKTYGKDYNAIFGIAILALMVLLHYILKLQKRSIAFIAEEEQKRVREELVHSNLGERQLLEQKYRQVQSYLENVAHQVRTPLTNILLNIGMIYEDQTAEDRAVLDECGYHAERIKRLVERLLKIGRLEAGRIEFEKQEGSLKQLLERAAASCHDEARIRLKLSEVLFYMDEDWLYEAFLCLLDNCLEHIGPENHVFVTLKKEADKAIIRVEDDGSGFSEEDLPYIFERFYSSGDIHASKHYGVGLNLAKIIVEGHFGTITAYNRREGGAGFSVVLPKYQLKPGKNRKI